MLFVHEPESPHHVQLEIFVVEGFIAARGEWEAVGDLQSCVGHEAQERALSDPQVGKVNFVTMLDQLHYDLDYEQA